METEAKEYEFTKDMDEISGFGGSYEDACRNMVIAGVEWLDENPDADPQYRGYKGIYGVIKEENEAAKAMTKVMIAASGDDCTGAMHQATVSHVLFIKSHSWEEYVKKMEERD